MDEQSRSNPNLSDILSLDTSGAPAGSSIINRALQIVRSHLGMDVAFISEFHTDHRVFRHVDAEDWLTIPLKEGDTLPLEDGYCRRVVNGQLPELIPDTAAVPEAMALPHTTNLPIGAHLSVPIRLSDGRIFGTFCCFSHAPDTSLTYRDLEVMRAFADLSGFQIERDLREARELEQKRARVEKVLNEQQLSVVYQPIRAHETGNVVGFECLARFPSSPYRSPDLWFGDAREVGLTAELDLLSLRLGLSALHSLPTDLYVAVNISPETILADRFATLLSGLPLERVVLELTEHAQVADYEGLVRALEPLRLKGVQLAIDDAGAGYASLRHILRLNPDLIKLDLALVRNIDQDAAKRALAAALVVFGRETGAKIVAEGVETAHELRTLSELGIKLTQGYLLGKPMPLASAVELAAAQPAADDFTLES